MDSSPPHFLSAFPSLLFFFLLWSSTVVDTLEMRSRRRQSLFLCRPIFSSSYIYFLYCYYYEAASVEV